MASGIVPSSSLNTDWLLSTASNVHIAKDPAWFVNYEPFSSYDQGVLDGGRLNAIGIGDVNIPVKIHPKRTGSAAHGILVFYDVLHVPDAICNIVGLGRGSLPFHSISLPSAGKPGAIHDSEGRRIATVRQAQLTILPALLLSGPPHGPGHCASSFREGHSYALSVNWPAEEEARWGKYKNELEGRNATARTDCSMAPGDPNASEPPYTDDELSWVKEHFGGEKAFLEVASTEIEDEDDRDFGRKIMRDMTTKIIPQMEDLAKVRSGVGAVLPSIPEIVTTMMHEHNSGLFDEDERAFLDEEFGGHHAFMKGQGFRYSDPDDCGEAKSLVRAMMGLSDDDKGDGSDEEQSAFSTGQTNYLFTENELKSMRAEGGSTEGFMIMHGLKF